jgi:hypothetical protein
MKAFDPKPFQNVTQFVSPPQDLLERDETAAGFWARMYAGMRRLRAKATANAFALEALRHGNRTGGVTGTTALDVKGHEKPAHWLQVLHDPMSVFRGRGFVLADTANAASRGLTYDLSTIGFDVDMCDDHDAVMGVLQSEGAAGLMDCLWSVLLVDLDFLTQDLSLEEVVDDLLSLRQSMGALNIILLSNEVFGRSEADTTRLAIADVSLRTPVSGERLREAVWDARSNNMVWQERLQELERVEGDERVENDQISLQCCAANDEARADP